MHETAISPWKDQFEQHIREGRVPVGLRDTHSIKPVLRCQVT